MARAGRRTVWAHEDSFRLFLRVFVTLQSDDEMSPLD